MRSGGDWVFDIDVTPNRAADSFSHLGIARECEALTNVKRKTQNTKLREDEKTDIREYIQIEVENKKDCPRYTGRVIIGVKVKPSPKYIRERLQSCGLEPINNIVDAANYVMLETGQPLHAFDLDKIQNKKAKIQSHKLKVKKIIIRRAKMGERIDGLDDKTYRLDEDILVIADSKNPIAIAGIKGGRGTAIDMKTKNIFLESANFNHLTIRRASKKLNLRTDASLRFEHGMDANLTAFAIDRLAELIQETAGGKILKNRKDVGYKKALPKKIKLDLRQAEKLLGIKLSKNEAIKILRALEFGIDKNFNISIPSWRPDITASEDLIEEIGRIYGYGKLKSVFPRLALVPAQKNEEITWEEKIKNILKALGFFEIYNYSFISKKAGDYLGTGLVELENPFSEQFYYLRPNLLINLLDNIKHNSKYFQKEKELKIFELGAIFKQKRNEIEEKKMLVGMLISGEEDFYILKGVIDSLLNGLGISDRFYDNYQATSDNSQQVFWNPIKSAEIKIGSEEIGFIGELSPKILSKLGVKEKVTAFELDFAKFVKLCREEQEYQAVSKFPSAVRDVAVLVPQDVKVADVLNRINIAGKDLVRDVDLFDIYQGEELEQGKKNLAFHIIFQAGDRTLQGKEIDELFERIIKALEAEPSWEIRKN